MKSRMGTMRPQISRVPQLRAPTPADVAASRVQDASGAWRTISGGSPGGSTAEIQYNAAGAFGGIAGSSWDGTNLSFALGAGSVTIGGFGNATISGGQVNIDCLSGQAYVGDVNGAGNSTLFTVDDANARAVINSNFVVDKDGGLYLKDAGGHYWKLTVSLLGVISTSDTGTSLP